MLGIMQESYVLNISTNYANFKFKKNIWEIHIKSVRNDSPQLNSMIHSWENTVIKNTKKPHSDVPYL